MTPAGVTVRRSQIRAVLDEPGSDLVQFPVAVLDAEHSDRVDVVALHEDALGHADGVAVLDRRAQAGLLLGEGDRGDYPAVLLG